MSPTRALALASLLAAAPASALPRALPRRAAAARPAVRGAALPRLPAPAVAASGSRLELPAPPPDGASARDGLARAEPAPAAALAAESSVLLRGEAGDREAPEAAAARAGGLFGEGRRASGERPPAAVRWGAPGRAAHEEEPGRVLRAAPGTAALLAANGAVFAAQAAGGSLGPRAEPWGLRLDALARWPSEASGHDALTALTHAFAHMNPEHFASNMAALAVFGAAAERLYGTTRLLALAVASIAAAAAWGLLAAYPGAWIVGASGMIMGLAASTLWTMLAGPKARPLSTLIGLLVALIVGGEVVRFIEQGPAAGGVAVFVHVAGAAAGLLLGGIFHLTGGRRER